LMTSMSRSNALRKITLGSTPRNASLAFLKACS
jgi:hypothetical protein